MSTNIPPFEARLLLENENLRLRLAEAEEAINAIRHGEVDAIVVSVPEGGDKIFSLNSSETPYRHVIEQMNEGAVTISSEGTIHYCNRRFSELVGVPLEFIIGANFAHFFTTSEYLKFEKMLQNYEEKRNEEFTIVLPDQRLMYLKFSFSQLPKEMLGDICIVVTNITDLKKYQDRLAELVQQRTTDLEKTNLRLKELNATKDKLFSIIAHDLRNPFTTLLGFSDLLKENIQTYSLEKIEEMISYMHSAAKSTYILLENLLMWAKSQNDQVNFSPVEFNFSKSIRSVVDSFRSMAKIKNLTLKYNCIDAVFGFADENMFQTILRNLIVNSIKFTGTGGTIEVSVFSNDIETRITVADTGTGMSEEMKNKLLSNNTNVSSNGTAQEQGTGLGLIICKEFLEKHHGHLFIESQLNQGSNFTFTLPHRGQLEPVNNSLYSQHEKNIS